MQTVDLFYSRLVTPVSTSCEYKRPARNLQADRASAHNACRARDTVTANPSLSAVIS